jgi:hypothetical protein
VILPAEHGSWSLMLTPFVMGAGVAAVTSSPADWGSVAVCLLAVLMLFLVRQPLALWVRIRRGKASKSRESEALSWSLLLLGIAAVCGDGLALFDRSVVFLLAIPAGLILAATLGMGAWFGPRQMATELVGVVGLALAAPAAYGAASGKLDFLAGLVWVISALHSVISILYVRLRVDHRHERASTLQAAVVVVGHVLSLIAVVAGALVGWVPWLVGVPLALLTLRAAVVTWRQPPLENVVRFGFTEMGLALIFAAIVVAAFVSAR